VPVRVHQDFQRSSIDQQRSFTGGGDLAEYLIFVGYTHIASDRGSRSALERVQARLAERYAVVRELGRGGMATVYLATTSSTSANRR